MIHISLQIIYGACASLIYAILFQCDKKNLFGAALTGGFGIIIYEIVLSLNGSIYIANFLAAIGFQIIAEYFAVRFKTTVTTFSICALMPLVPGAGMYYTMVYVINGHTSYALMKCLETLSVAAMLALGIMIVSTFARIYRTKKRNALQ